MLVRFFDYVAPPLSDDARWLAVHAILTCENDVELGRRATVSSSLRVAPLQVCLVSSVHMLHGDPRTKRLHGKPFPANCFYKSL
ncbi:hypothetical protein LPU83_pLPU83d_1066 (plasmid) [Rhizobium favelukesii]|uniref:Uncharacterized protein n=1 Tax=Rhizobium favelukesii TaxID=348824 RepID=W6S8K3_9HYPH|nr:hypothetical protein LPU83_pLPU83d_1066 [Rhizobium favelukesii]